MPIKKPHRVFVEFEDGSTCEAPFESLPETLQSDIMRQPFASKPAPEPEKEKFLILEWDDGWKEVIRVDDTCRELNRYYVISRVEHVGRLSIRKQNGYPELIEIIRKPLNLNRITFADDFQVALQRSDREGDKTDHFFTLTKEEGARRKRIDEFKAIIEQQAIDLEVLRSQEPHTQLEHYEKIRKALSIKAGLRQQDCYDYIAFLLNTDFKISLSPR